MLIPWVFFLKDDEQLLVETFTRRRVVNGPTTFFGTPFDRLRRRKALTLGPTEYLHVRDTLTGQVRTERGPQLYFQGANEEFGQRQTAMPLKRNEYVHVLDKRTGAIRTERGESSVYLEPTEALLGETKQTAITLKRNEYLRVIDKRTGIIRVERGENSVYLEPTEEMLEGVKAGINIDEHTAVLVRDLQSGQLSLVTEPQVFMPAPHQEIVEARRRILLEDHQVVVIRDKEGKYEFRRGAGEARSFFLEPYAQLVQLLWSTGLHKDQRTLKITHFDLRPKFMWYEFEARTQDNVEIVIGITFFWQIVDIETMMRATDDAPGDLCSHARSAIIQSVSQVPLDQFLADFNALVRRAVLDAGDAFYAERGAQLNAVEVRSITCKDAATQRILLEIIQETTNRLNRLQKQSSENEVQVKQIEGQVEAEARRARWLELRRQNAETEALTVGQGEAQRVRAFIDGLGTELPIDAKLALFNTLRKQEALERLSQGTAQLYFTPQDVDLTIESRGRPNSPARG
jgi:hypothetical protein